MNHNKIDYISRARTFAIILVVLGHSLPVTQDGYRSISAQLCFNFIYSFHMSLFMFVSGLLFYYTNNNRPISYGSFVKKKTVRLILPYFAISTVAYSIKVFLSRFAVRPIDLSVKSYFTSMLYPDTNAIAFYWFIFALFVIFLISPLLKLVLQKSTCISLILLLLLLLLYLYNPVKTNLFCLDRVAKQMLFFYLGCFVCRFFLDGLNNLNNIIIALMAFVLLCVYSYYVYGGNPKLPFIPAFVGILMVISVSQLLQGLDITKWLSGYSYQVYLLSWFPQVVFNILFRMGKLPFGVASTAMFLTGLFLPVLISRIVEKRIGMLKPVIGM